MAMIGGAAPGALPYDPSALSGADRLMLAGAMLRDVGSGLRGGDSSSVLSLEQMLAGRQLRAAQLNAINGMELSPDMKTAAMLDPAGFLENYTKGAGPQALREGETAIYGGPGGATVTAPKLGVSTETGNTYTQGVGGTDVTGNVGAPVKVQGPVITQGANILGTIEQPTDVAPGSKLFGFTPNLTYTPPAGLFGGGAPAGPAAPAPTAGPAPITSGAPAATSGPAPSPAAPATPQPAAAGGVRLLASGNDYRPLPMADRAQWNISPSDPRPWVYGPDGKPQVAADVAYTPKDVAAQRGEFYKSPEYSEYVNAVTGANNIEKLFHAFGKNNSVMNQGALDNTIRVMTGLSAKNQNVVNFMEHMGLPDQLKGAITQKFGNGYLTPDVLMGIRTMSRAYADAHRSAAAQRLTNETAFAKANGADLGVTLPQMDRQVPVKWLDGTGKVQGGVVAPQVGEVREGYRFVGGDPSKPTSWSKVAQ